MLFCCKSVKIFDKNLNSGQKSFKSYELKLYSITNNKTSQKKMTDDEDDLLDTRVIIF